LTFVDSLLEKETKRLEEELQKLQFSHEVREKELQQVRSECERMAREIRRVNGGNGNGEVDGEDNGLPPAFSLDSPAGKFINSAYRDVCYLFSFYFILVFIYFTCISLFLWFVILFYRVLIQQWRQLRKYAMKLNILKRKLT
jgi:hypothetical protein